LVSDVDDIADRKFLPDFVDRAGRILRRLFRIYAHLYHVHYEKMIELKMDAHLNTSFKHFVFFVRVRRFSWPILAMSF